MIQMDPPITRKTMSTPNASARTLLVLSGPVVMCRKKNKVHAHLRYGEDDQCHREGRPPDEAGGGQSE